MTGTPGTWTVATVTDAARVRTAVARLAADAPLRERTRFVAGLTAHLRHCLGRGGTWEAVITPVDGDASLQVAVRPAGHPPDDPPPWHRVLTCAEPPRPLTADSAAMDEATYAEAVLAADDDIARILDKLDEAEALVRFHREELHQTNQGVLALHAELEAAALAQRELLRAEKASGSEAENARRLLTFLADASAAVTASLDPDDIPRRLAELLVPRYARRLDVWLLDDESAPSLDGRPAAAVAAARSGRPQHAAAHPGGLPGVDDLPPSALAPGHALLCIPLTGRRTLGVLTLTAPGPRFHPDETVMLIEVARRAATALENARLYAHHRDTAETLQRAQLTELPTSPDLLLAARYLPATRGLNIGGDWYDVFPQPDGSLLTVIGDVTGHGLRAAVMMGQLRTALRAYAVDGDSPAQLLTRLHRLLHHQQPDLYATAVIARFRPGDPHVVWASAGHPPALVRAPDGTVRTLDTKPGLMLGVPLPYEYRDHTVRLAPGSTLALYTDGLVERRAKGIDPGTRLLTRALGALSTAELEQDLDSAAESLLKQTLHDSDRDDDVCLLLCHTAAAPATARPRP